MSSVQISGNASGAGVLTIAAPNTASNFTLTLPTATTTLVGTDATQTLTNKTLTSPNIGGAPAMNASVITSGTSVASTSGTSIDFTGIPSWVKRITVMFNGVSLSSTANYLIQIGAGSITSTGYVSTANNGSGTSITSTSGFVVTNASAATDLTYGFITINSFGSNIWTQGGNLNNGNSSRLSAGGVTLSGTLDRLRITTTSGTDTFDAGSINILYE